MKPRKVFVISSYFEGVEQESVIRVASTEEKAMQIKEEMTQEILSLDDFEGAKEDEYFNFRENEYSFSVWTEDYQIYADVKIEEKDIE